MNGSKRFNLIIFLLFIGVYHSCFCKNTFLSLQQTYQPFPISSQLSNSFSVLAVCIQLEQYAHTPRTQNAWRQFVLQLHKNPSSLNYRFVSLLHKLMHLKVVNFWLDSFFLPIWYKHSTNPIIATKKLLKTYEKDKDYLEEILFKQRNICRISPLPRHQPAKIENKLHILTEQILPFFASSYVSSGQKIAGTKQAIYSFARSFSNMGALSKLAALHAMKNIVTIFDDIFNGSNQLTPQIQNEYSKLFSHWKELLPNATNNQITLHDIPKMLAKKHGLDGYL